MADGINQSDTPTDPATHASIGATEVEHTSRFDRIDWLSFALTSLLALVIYLFTVAPGVTLEFSGILSTGAWYAGVAHPPGYPIWTIYSWLFATLLPFSNIAWRVAVGSAVAAALASGTVAMIASSGGKLLMEHSTRFERLKPHKRNWIRIVCGYVAGLALGLSGAVWRKAVIADVWALSLLLFTVILWLTLRWMRQPEQKRFLCAGFLLLGMLLTSNQEMIVMLPGLVFAVILSERNLGRDLALTVLPLAAMLTTWSHYGLWVDFPYLWNLPLLFAFSTIASIGAAIVVGARRFGSAWKSTLLCHVSFLLGLSLCLYLPLSSMANPPTNWGYSRTVEGFFHVVSCGQYERVYPTDDLGRYTSQLWMFVKMAGKELGWLYLMFAALAFCGILRIDQRVRKWVLALLMMFICVGPLLVAEINSPPKLQSQELLSHYFTPSFAVLSVLVGLGLTVFAGLVGTRKPVMPNDE